MTGDEGCGAALISRIHVLSVAHCAEACTGIENNKIKCHYKTVNWATLGDHDKRKEDGEIYVKITKPYHVHPKARQPRAPEGAFTYDYVIFVLACCVEYNEYIQPVCLPEKSFRPQLFGKKVITMGWGDTEWDGKGSPKLLAIEIELLDDKICKNIMERSVHTFKYDPSFLTCAGDPKTWDKDTCQNDSGGMF